LIFNTPILTVTILLIAKFSYLLALAGDLQKQLDKTEEALVKVLKEINEDMDRYDLCKMASFFLFCLSMAQIHAMAAISSFSCYWWMLKLHHTNK